jgi:branched-chain amino acid transport system substrate-binding protein
MRRLKVVTLVSVAAALSLTMSACSSSKGSTTTSTSSAATTASSAAASTSSSSSSSTTDTGKTIKLGVITDSTGVAASGYTTTETGIKAYVNYINDNGGINGSKVSYVMGDSTSTPAGALSAAQKLVQTNKVFAILSVTSDLFGAEPYLLKAGIPVIGTGFDGPEWEVQSNTNMFDAEGPSDPATVYTTNAMVMKSLGATTCGAVGYVESPSSAKSATASIKSCTSQGLKGADANDVSFGSTDMAPVALSMKAKGVDGIFMGVVPNTGFALAAALRQANVTPKAFLLATGYGGDLLSSAAAVTAAQGFQFSSTGQPVESNTPATQLEVKNLAAVGESRTPTFAEQTSYIIMSAVAAGLKAAGTNPTQASFMTAMRGVKGFNADGLLSPESLDFSSYTPAMSCEWVVTLTGKKFVPLPQSPFCGHKVASS